MYLELYGQKVENQGGRVAHVFVKEAQVVGDELSGDELSRSHNYIRPQVYLLFSLLLFPILDKRRRLINSNRRMKGNFLARDVRGSVWSEK